jgi:hypothetical protein
MQPPSSAITIHQQKQEEEEEEEEEEAALSSSSLPSLFGFSLHESCTLFQALHPHQYTLPIEDIRFIFQLILMQCIYNVSYGPSRYNMVRLLLLMYPNIINTVNHRGTPLFYLTTIDNIETHSIPKDIILKLISPESMSIGCNFRSIVPWHVHTPLENALYLHNHFMVKILLQHATPQQFPSIAVIIHLIHGHIPLQYLAALSIKSTLTSKTDTAYATLGLPPSLINFTKTLNLDSYYLPPIPDYLPRPSVWTTRPSPFHHLHTK